MKVQLAGACALLWFGQAAMGGVITVLPIGDSITAGYNGAPMAGYRQDLLADLAVGNIGVQYVGVFDPTLEAALGSSEAMTSLGQNSITAFGGFRSADILNNLDGDAASPGLPTAYPFSTNHGGFWLTGGHGTGRSAITPQVALLMIGTNDPVSAYGANLTPVQTDQNIALILSWFAVNRPSTTVLIASPPPDVQNDQLYTHEIAQGTRLEEAWLKANINQAEFPNARFVDTYASFIKSNGTVNADLFCADGVHPDDAGYAVVAADFSSAVQSEIPEPAGPSLVFAAGVFVWCRCPKTKCI